MSRGGRIFAATSNAGKLAEIRSLFSAANFEIEVDAQYVSPLEGERSYTDNAALKAHALFDALRARGIAAGVLADDSGLEVYALDRRPGVMTADYGGGAGWSERRRMLLAELAHAGGRDRRARFVCAMHFIGPAGREFAALGTVEGELAAAERGELGFSFDPIFLYPPAGKTFAELSAAQKDRISHRAIAAAAIVAAIDASTRPFEPQIAAALRGSVAGEREDQAPTGRSSAW